MTSEVIPFYGANQRDVFEIERRTMDRRGSTIQFLNENLPGRGLILDLGAGSGYTAAKLQNGGRELVLVEPAHGMVTQSDELSYVRGTAQSLPLHSQTFDAVYSTWAYFLDGMHREEAGLEQVKRVLKPGGLHIIINNFGQDEFCSYASVQIHSNPDFYTKRGYEHQILESSFDFDSLEEARYLMTHFFSEAGKRVNSTRVEYKISAFYKYKT